MAIISSSVMARRPCASAASLETRSGYPSPVSLALFPQLLDDAEAVGTINLPSKLRVAFSQKPLLGNILKVAILYKVTDRCPVLSCVPCCLKCPVSPGRVSCLYRAPCPCWSLTCSTITNTSQEKYSLMLHLETVFTTGKIPGALSESQGESQAGTEQKAGTWHLSRTEHQASRTEHQCGTEHQAGRTIQQSGRTEQQSGTEEQAWTAAHESPWKDMTEIPVGKGSPTRD